MSEVKNIPEGWVETTLGEVIDIFNQQRIPLSAQVRTNRKGIYPYYGASNIFDYIDDYIFDGEYLLISEDGENLNTRNTPIAFIVKGKFWVNNHAHIVKGKSEHLTKYLELYFSKLDISPFITGAVQPKLSKGNLIRIPILLPKNINEQKSIATILTAFDDKIELLQAQNKTLEAIAQTIFTEWFGKYQIGDDLPDGWKVGRLGEVGKIICGKTPSKSNNDYFGNDIPFIKIPDMHNKMFILETTDNLSTEGAMSQNNKMLPKDSICISCIATVGLVSITTKDSQTNQQINSIIPNNQIYREYLYFTLTKMNDYLNDLGSGGTATLNVNTSTFSNIELVIPSENNLKEFHQISNPIFEKVLQNNTQIQTLTKTRDELLPRLMSGAVRVM